MTSIICRRHKTKACMLDILPETSQLHVYNTDQLHEFYLYNYRKYGQIHLEWLGRLDCKFGGEGERVWLNKLWNTKKIKCYVNIYIYIVQQNITWATIHRKWMALFILLTYRQESYYYILPQRTRVLFSTSGVIAATWRVISTTWGMISATWGL